MFLRNKLLFLVLLSHYGTQHTFNVRILPALAELEFEFERIKWIQVDVMESFYHVYVIFRSMEKQIPMVSLGLRETTEVNFKVPFMVNKFKG